MAFQDKPIQCFDRGVTFTFIPEEQASFNLRDLPTHQSGVPLAVRQEKSGRQALVRETISPATSISARLLQLRVPVVVRAHNNNTLVQEIYEFR